MQEEERRKLFEEFSGSLDKIVDEKAEKLEALDEQYGVPHNKQ